MILDVTHVDAEGARERLRQYRSDRPDPVLSGRRGSVYATALAQAEELWATAQSVEPLVGPILRYYALAQLAQALAAASALPNSGWETAKWSPAEWCTTDLSERVPAT